MSYNKNNSGHIDSLEVGNTFEDFVCITLAQEGIILQNIHSKKFQYETGENLQGFEIKLDNRCTGCNSTKPTHRLSIEIAEKTDGRNVHWVQSGIYRDDNSWLYIHGNYMMFWIFSKKLLRMLHKSGRYTEAEAPRALPTVRKFYIPISDADKYCIKKLVFENHQ